MSTQAARPVLGAFFGLQEERRLSEAALADPAGYQNQLRAQRARTDVAVNAVEALPDSAWSAPADIRADVVDLGKSPRNLADHRAGVDGRSASPQQRFDRYTDLVSRHLKVFNTLSTVGLPGIDHLVRPVLDEDRGLEMISRQDALLTRASVTGKLSGTDRGQLAARIGAQQFIYDNNVVPLLSADEARQFASSCRAGTRTGSPRGSGGTGATASNGYQTRLPSLNSYLVVEWDHPVRAALRACRSDGGGPRDE